MARGWHAVPAVLLVPCLVLGSTPIAAGVEPASRGVPLTEEPAPPSRSNAAVSFEATDEAPAVEPVDAQPQVPPLSPPRRTKTALIIGINDEDAADPLSSAVTDALYVREALYRYGFRPEDVTVLLEDQATRPQVLDELRRLADRTPSSGLAVFAWSGHGGSKSLRTAEGARLHAGELSSALSAVPSPMWVSLAACNAGAYALPGIVGPGRVATFSSQADQRTYEATRGSHLMLQMVRYGMIDGHAAASVEEAFAFAERSISEVNPQRAPVMFDGVAGDLVLGPVPARTAGPGEGHSGSDDGRDDRSEHTPGSHETTSREETWGEHSSTPDEEPTRQPTPEPDPTASPTPSPTPPDEDPSPDDPPCALPLCLPPLPPGAGAGPISL